MSTERLCICFLKKYNITKTAITADSVFAYEKNQAVSQTNACGNGELPLNVGCQNIDSQIQGDENSVVLAADQVFPSIEDDENGQK